MGLEDLVPLPVILPLVGAGITLAAAGHTRIQRFTSLSVVTAVLAVSMALLWATDQRGPQVVHVGGWPPTEGIVLVADRLSALMLIVSSAVTLAVLRYSVGLGRSAFDEEHDGEAPLPIFHPTLLVLTAGVSTTFVSGDLFHLYVGFEMLLAASFVLLTLGGTQDRVRAGISYAYVSLLSSLVFLVAIALIYASTGTVNMAILAQRLDALPPGTSLALHAMLLLGFAIKAAVFPLSGWLPDSYPTAPAPVTAVFAGLLTKVGIYAMIRTQTLLFPDGRLNTLLLWAALLTMLVGILGAVAQDDIKRMLSFTLVSHIGYMLFGIAVGSEKGYSSAIFYVVHHIAIQTTLFLVAGLIERFGGSTSLSRLSGLATSAPLLGVLFFVPALNLAGIPPFSGFLGKVGLMQAGADLGTPLAYLLLAGSALTSLLTLYAVSRVWGRAFWRAPEEAMAGNGPGAVRASRERALTYGVVMPTAVLVVVGVGLTVVAGPLFHITDRAAADLLNRSTYVQSVLVNSTADGGAP
ncbi:Na+/H+ antiporter subunit D [Luteipulveratus sp. YIM 133132]|uniref:Na+/H+ antiporter subunit D n=1 Tax=Luteipulveratus flavus TaxID=3031728 RepID=UPI0023B0C636|nr:Na+/H+ antiporter subunit D [Luteipulveratus sp. YIM 133132]MDE9364265.1 Na+/H+ antiporter subunit D [Luteipulveratus sp. YIM 133132]